jgi:hypothetical protein
MKSPFLAPLWRALGVLAALLMLGALTPAFAQQEAPDEDPPGRVAHLTHRQGSVVFAPQGEDEWVELPANRPLTAGDRLWSDRQARAELHLGAATLHVDGESHVGLSKLEDNAAQLLMLQGSVHARVRELAPGENFEIGTPNLALRALEPGDFRLDVDAGGGETRVVVLSGRAVVFGEGGNSVQLGAGQQATFAGRALAPVQQAAWQQDEFGQWAAERNRAEDQSLAARHVPRGVVGYQQLDQHGTWSTDATHGPVWYPQVTVQDWAPYRHGRWEWIQPWGWTWIDDAPWGFAPFHYGRWAQIGSRWAWVPGQMAARPVYSPGLVVFVGGAGVPGMGWYPLAPGEAWWPTYRTSPRYLSALNFHIDLNRYHRHYGNHFHRQRAHAVTVVPVDHFRSGRPVRHGWQPGHAFGSQGQLGWVPARPERRLERHAPPRLSAVPPATPWRQWQGWTGRDGRDVRDVRDGRNGRDRREAHEHREGGDRNRMVAPAPVPRQAQQGDGDRALREQRRAQWEQERLQRDAERAARQQQRREAWQQQQPAAAPALQQAPQQDGSSQRQQRREAWQQRQQHQPSAVQAVPPAVQQQPQQPQWRAQLAQPQQPPVQQAVPIGRQERGERMHGGERREGREGRDGRGPRGDDQQRGRN